MKKPSVIERMRKFSRKYTEAAFEGDFVLSTLQVRLIGEVMLRSYLDRSESKAATNLKATDTQAHILSYGEFVEAFMQIRMVDGRKVVANCIVATGKTFSKPLQTEYTTHHPKRWEWLGTLVDHASKKELPYDQKWIEGGGVTFFKDSAKATAFASAFGHITSEYDQLEQLPETCDLLNHRLRFVNFRLLQLIKFLAESTHEIGEKYMIFSPEIQQRYAQERTWHFSDSRTDFELVPEFELLEKESKAASEKVDSYVTRYFEL